MVDRMAGYEPVQARLARFWADHELGRIKVRLIENDTQHVLAKASIWRVMGDPFPASEGWAQEVHDGSPVNRQGWMIENAETSAIGRALANLGYAPNQARPTQEDMERAAARQLADENLARATMDHVLTLKGTPRAAELKKYATRARKSIAYPAMRDDPEWREQVDNWLREHPAPADETSDS